MREKKLKNMYSKYISIYPLIYQYQFKIIDDTTFIIFFLIQKCVVLNQNQKSNTRFHYIKQLNSINQI